MPRARNIKRINNFHVQMAFRFATATEEGEEKEEEEEEISRFTFI